MMTLRCLAALPPPPWPAAPPDPPMTGWRLAFLAVLLALVALAGIALAGFAGYAAHHEHLWQDTLASFGLGEPVADARAAVTCDYHPGGRRSSGYYRCETRILLGDGAAPVAGWSFDAAWGLYDNPADLARGVRRLSFVPGDYAMVTTGAGLLDRAAETLIGPIAMIAFCSIPLVVIAARRRSQGRLVAAAARGHLAEVAILRRIKRVGKGGVTSWLWDVAYDDPATGARRYHTAHYADGVHPLATDWGASRGLALMGERKPQALLTEGLWPLALAPADQARVIAAAADDREADHASRRQPPDSYRDWTEEAQGFAAQFDKAKALAAEGDGDACYTVGWIHYHGQGTPKDAASAAKWFKFGALADDPRAQHNLAHQYHHGDGVPKDHRLAVFWAQVAARRYNRIEDAQSALGLRSNASLEVRPDELDRIIRAACDWRPGMAVPG